MKLKQGGESNSSPPRRGIDRSGLITAALLAFLCAVVVWSALNTRNPSVYGLGPQALPLVIACGIALLAIGTLVAALRGTIPQPEAVDFVPVVLILGGIAALIAVIGFGGGFIIATTILFATTARAFGRTAFMADIVIGFALSVTIYLIFNKLLTLSLPAGPLERLF